MNSGSHYDVAIIGAGLSGLAAGIRLAHFGQRVCIFERHNAVGGLNGFYSIKGRKFDVGLHAVTNFVPPGTKGTPLGKLLRQLRLDRDELDLCPQKVSRVAFGPAGEIALRFSNDWTLLEAEVAGHFPRAAPAFRALVAWVRGHPLAGEGGGASARAFLRDRLGEPVLEDLLLCPLMFYGSARENDLELDQFAIMFRALYLEGFARPLGGVRPLLRVLLDKYRAAGGERRMACGVRRIVAAAGRADALILDSGETITATHVLSSIGAAETAALLAAPAETGAAARADEGAAPAAGAAPAGAGPGRRLAFVETIAVLDRPPAELGWGDETIVFFNETERFDYAPPTLPVDVRSGIICFPNNFEYGPGRALAEGSVRCTCLANYAAWAGLEEGAYRAEKQRWFERIQASAQRFLPPCRPPDGLARATVATDMFTPRTVERYTGHREGAIYGSPVKHPDGATALANLHLCGTDQGLLGIVGAMLSGIGMANRHVLAAGAGAAA